MDRADTIEGATHDGLDRREFTLRAALAMLAGVTITVSGCGGGGGTGGGGSPMQPTTDPSTGDKVGNISADHGHRAVITAAELAAGGALILQIRGTADHPHTVPLTAAEVVAIRNGQRVGKASSDEDFHTHTVTFN
ncbi:MAG TPA: hypothetical protein VMT87_03160 [Vicinamibacteria bacterium]|nr:hypothetical protein [Vicinamibacteria bacterium]